MEDTLIISFKLPSCIISRRPNGKCNLSKQKLVPMHQFSGTFDSKHCHHGRATAQHAAFKCLQLGRDEVEAVSVNRAQPHAVGHQHAHRLAAVLMGVPQRAIDGSVSAKVAARSQVRTRGAQQHFQHAGLPARGGRVRGCVSPLVARVHIHQPALQKHLDGCNVGALAGVVEEGVATATIVPLRPALAW